MFDPNEYDDDSGERDADETFYPEDDYDLGSIDDYILCPRCESFEMPYNARYCWRCEHEIWLNENA